MIMSMFKVTKIVSSKIVKFNIKQKDTIIPKYFFFFF